MCRDEDGTGITCRWVGSIELLELLDREARSLLQVEFSSANNVSRDFNNIQVRSEKY